jgi:hypothetical protein
MIALLEALTAAGTVALTNAARRTAVSVGGLLLCAALLAASLAFFTLAAYRALAEAVGPIHAPLAVGGAYLIFALVGLLIVQSRR